MRALVVLPTYNEAATVVELLRRVRLAASDVEVLVVDDDSPDGTADLAEKAAIELGGVHVLRRSGHLGFASAYKDGLAWGLARDVPVFVQMDADLSHDPAKLPELLSKLDDCDMVIGSRYIPGGSVPRWGWHRRFLSWGGNKYATFMLGLPVRDVTSGYRAMSAATVRSLDLDAIKAEGYAFLIELAFRLDQGGAKIAEVPIVFVDRELGKSKMSGVIALESLRLTTRWGLGRWWRKSASLRSRLRAEDRSSGVVQGGELAKVDVGGILEEYVSSAPSGENAVNIFRGEWSSRLPPPYDKITGLATLFEDERINWTIDRLGGIEGYRILELGPLEGGHTTMLESAGAESITAIEANTRAYLKCLIVKELLGLQKSTFQRGDFVEYLRTEPGPFDLCVASGVLYHMIDPIEFLRLISKVSDRVFLWTHYYDYDLIQEKPVVAAKFGPAAANATSDGFQYQQFRYDYFDALNWPGFCGGSNTHSNWLQREDILAYLRLVGYTSVEIAFDHTFHPNGPAFGVLAQK